MGLGLRAGIMNSDGSQSRRRGRRGQSDSKSNSRSQAAISAVLVLVEVAVGVLANVVTTAGPALIISFVGLASVLVAAAYWRVRGYPNATPGVRWRRLIRSRWWPSFVLFTGTWIAMAVIFVVSDNESPRPLP